MLSRAVIFILLLVLFMPGLFSQGKFKPQNSASVQFRYHHQITQGYNMELLMSPLGIIGGDVFKYSSDSIPIGLEYPEWSEIEHLGDGGIWIGALINTVVDSVGEGWIKRVSTSNNASGIKEHTPYYDYFSETTPTDTSNPWIHRSIIDEDSGAISESDYICEYTDTAYLKDYPEHMPLGVKVIQRSYAWARAIREPIIPIDYTIINIGKKLLKDVYIGIYLNPDVGSIYFKYYYRYNYTGYFPDLRTAYIENGKDPNATPMGFTILCTPTQIQTNNYRFYWHSSSVPLLSYSICFYDSVLYDLMCGNIFSDQQSAIKPNQKVDDQWDVSLLFSFGPIEKFEVGETLRVALALVGGLTAKYGFYSIYDNAKVAHTLFARNYYAPIVLPAPDLRIEVGFQRVKLTWDYQGNGINPEDVWDDGSHILQSYPSDHWRRANPPEGHTKGGRIFEGYRLYRSEDPGGTAKSFVMLKQWDMVDSIGPKYGYDVGLEYEFIDSNLHTGKTYWYSVTSYGIEDMNVINYVDWDGSVKVETLATKSNETSVLAARKRVKVPFSLSNELGRVLVVPNPYRVDDNYTLEFGGYEGRSRSWNENKRMLKFTHLPPKCTIRIFTIGGDIVATLHHENQTIGEYDWNMLSESNRTIASGVYVFTVESEYGTQTGKFVVIR